MYEVKRVLGSRKIILAFLLIFVGNILFYLYEQYSKSYDFEAYKESYNTNLEKYKDKDYHLALQELEKSHEIYQGAAMLLYNKEHFDDERYQQRLEDAHLQSPDSIDQVLELTDSYTYEECFAVSEAIRTLMEQLQFMITYPDILDNIKSQADQMTTVSIFADKDSFSYKNIQKTVEDYAALENAELTLGSDLAVNSFFQDDITDYLILIMLILITLTFIEERKKGLWSLIHQGAAGRLPLGLWRTAIILFSSIIACCLLYGSKLLAAFILYGGSEDLYRLVQSMPIFKEFWIPMSITQLLWLYLAVKILGTFLIGMCLWLLVSCASYFNVAIASLGIFLGVEYSLYSLIRDSSILVLFKYVNIFGYLEQKQFFQHYMNLNLLKIPVQSGVLMLTLTPVLLIIFISAALIITSRKYPISSPSFFARALDSLRRKISARLKTGRIFINELYKSLVIQKGLILLAILLVVIVKTYYPGHIQLDNQEMFFESYMKIMNGPLNNETMNKINLKLQELQGQIEEEEKNLSKASEEESAAIQDRIQRLTGSLDNINSVKLYGDELLKRQSEEGIEAYFIPHLPYRSILDGNVSGSSSRLLAIIALTFLVLLAAPIFPYEMQRDMDKLLRASYRGREALWRRKAYSAITAAVLLWILTYGYELYSIVENRGGLLYLSAPVQNLTLLADFPWKLSILQYLLIFYGLRLLMLIAVAFLVMALSLFAKKTEQAIAIASAVILLPAAISMMEILDLGNLSLLRIIGVVEITSSTRGPQQVLPFAGVFILGALSLIVLTFKLKDYKE
ncbi:MAG: hypothetical protein ACI33K_06205 [Clostridiaceae bacterium]